MVLSYCYCAICLRQHFQTHFFHLPFLLPYNLFLHLFIHFFSLRRRMSLIDSGSYYILIINRPRLVREHRLIRWCIFHTAVFFFFSCNTIQRGDVLEYPLFIQNADKFDIYFIFIFFCPTVLRQPSVARCTRLTLIFQRIARLGQKWLSCLHY